MKSKDPIPYSEEDACEVQARLDTKLEASHLSYRPAAQGTVAYLEGWKAINLANEVFGFNGWSSEILSFSIDFTDIDANGKISLGMSCMVRVYLKDGTYHDDIGYGSADNQKSKAAAYEKAKKEAVTDALKRALRMFGNRLGNCAYDKMFLKDVKNIRPNSGVVNFRPANYPKPVTNESILKPATSSHIPPVPAHQPHQQQPQSVIMPQAQPNQNQKVSVAPPPLADENMFDNSMMISEEDLIASDENYGVFVQLEESYQREGIYPILPNKRK